MEFINNQYRVLREQIAGSAYLVRDLYDNKRKTATVIDSEYLSDDLIDFFSREYLVYRNITSSCVLKSLDFGIIKKINGKKSNQLLYYMISEYAGDAVSKPSSCGEIIKLFSDACRAAYYLHLKDIVYGEISPDMIVITADENGYSLKLKDLATVALYKHNGGGNIYFKAPEAVYEGIYDIQSDIYSLGVLLFYLHGDVSLKSKGFSKSFKDDFELYKSSNKAANNEHERKLIPIIEKMTCDRPNRYKSVLMALSDLNWAFQTNYKAFVHTEVCRLNINTPLVGMKAETSALISAFEKNASNRLDKRMAFVHGVYGTGKSTLLRDLYTKLRLKNMNVYASFDNTADGAIKVVLKQLLDDYTDTESDISDLIKYIYSYAYDAESDSHGTQSAQIIPVTQGISREKAPGDTNAILKFIYDCVKDKPAIFIIDELERANAYTINMFEKLLSVNKKMMLVISYRSSHENEALTGFITRQSANCYGILDFDLQPLNEAETAILIRQMLSLPNNPQVLAKTIFAKTGGNPLFATEILKNLLIDGTVYITEREGSWSIDLAPEDYTKIPIPATIAQAAHEFAAKVDPASHKLLTALSVFNIPVFADELAACLEISAESLMSTLSECVANGYLKTLRSGKGIRYDFANKILKDYLYGAMNYYTKRAGHALAAKALTSGATHSDSIYDEIIFQFEKAGRNDETLLQYLLANGEKYTNLSEYGRAIENFTKALEIMEQFGYEDGIPHIMLDISRLYDLTASREKKMEFIDMAADFVIKRDNQRNKASVLSLCAHWARKEYFHVAKALFDENPSMKTDYPADYASVLNTEAYHFEADYNKKMALYDKAFAICPPDSHYIRAKLLTCYGLIHYFNNNTEEALRNMHEALEANEKAKSYNNYAISLNNIADLHSTHLNDNKTAIRLYRECMDYCVAHRLSGVQMMSMDGLLYCYVRELDSKSALPLAQDMMLLSEMINSLEGVQRCSMKLHSIYIFTEQLDKACEISENIKEMLETKVDYFNLDHKETIASYLEQCVKLSLIMGDIEAAQGYFDSELFHTEDRAYLNMTPFIYGELLNIEKCISSATPDDGAFLSEGITESYKKIQALTEGKCMQPEITNIYCDLFITLNRYKCLAYIEDDFGKWMAHVADYKDLPLIIIAKLRYLQSLSETGASKIKLLTEARTAADAAGLTLTQATVCTALGNCYAGTSRYHSIHYLAEACRNVQGIVSGIPAKFKSSFVTRHNLLVPFEAILSDTELTINKTKPVFRDNIDIIFYKGLFTDISANESFQISAKEANFSRLPYGITEKEEVLKYFCDIPGKNLGLIAKYLAALTFASRCEIITDDDEDNDNEFAVIASDDEALIMQADKRILKRVKTHGTDIFEEAADGKKTVICIPVTCDCNGYIYLHSASVFNNFSAASMNECKWFLTLIGINLNLQKIKAGSSQDKLTGALNRITLEAAFDSYIKKAAETGSIFSVIFIDMDHFKSINDIYGHQAGDDVLRAVGKLIRSNIRKDTVFGRYGGEEFVLLLEGADSKAALALANKLRMLIKEAKLLGSKRTVTGSMGIAEYGLHDTTKAGLIEKADKALYICKQRGRDLCDVWSPAYTDEAKSENTLDGLITGDTIKDGARLRTLLDMIELIKLNMTAKEKMEVFLSKILDMTEAEAGNFLVIENDTVKSQFTRHSASIEQEGMLDAALINAVIIKREGYSGVKGKQSVICKPVIKDESVIGLLYLTSPAHKKEFKPADIGLVNYLSRLTAAVVD